MNTTQRIKALQVVERLNNMVSRTRLDMPVFVRRNREHIDGMLRELGLEVFPKAQLRQKHHRRWDSIAPKKQQRIIDKLAKKAAKNEFGGSSIRLRLARMGIVGEDAAVCDIESRSLRYARSVYSRISRKVHPKRHLRDGTPADRLHTMRMAFIVRAAYDCLAKVARLSKKLDGVPKVYLHPHLHPDDVDWTFRPTTTTNDNSAVDLPRSVLHCSLDILKINKLFPDLSHKLLAANLYLEDPPIKAEVYYCAYVKKGETTIERQFIGRCFDPIQKTWIATSTYKTARGAFTAARQIYASAMSRRIYDPGETKK